MENKKTIIVIVVILALICIIAIMTNVNKSNDETEEQGEATEQTSSETTVEEKSFIVKYGGIDITPGMEFDISELESAIEEEYQYYEVESCAFEGMDKVYTYSDVEITVCEIDGVDTVYSVYFLDENMETEDGIRITDSEEDMLDTYGEDYENDISNKYTYTIDNISLEFIVENNVITSIEYVLNI